MRPTASPTRSTAGQFAVTTGQYRPRGLGQSSSASALARRRRSLSSSTSFAGATAPRRFLRFGSLACQAAGLRRGTPGATAAVWRGHVAQRGHGLRHLVAEGQETGVAVQQVHVRAWAQQVEVLALAANVDQAPRPRRPAVAGSQSAR